MKDIKITKDEFKAYLAVQLSGVTNMFDTRIVSKLADLSREKILFIMENYGRLKSRFSSS